MSGRSWHTCSLPSARRERQPTRPRDRRDSGHASGTRLQAGQGWAYVVDVNPVGAPRKQRTIRVPDEAGGAGGAARDPAVDRRRPLRRADQHDARAVPDRDVAAGNPLVDQAEHMDVLRGLPPAVRRPAHRRPAAADADPQPAAHPLRRAGDERSGPAAAGSSARRCTTSTSRCSRRSGTPRRTSSSPATPPSAPTVTAPRTDAGEHLERRTGADLPPPRRGRSPVRAVAPRGDDGHATRRIIGLRWRDVDFTAAQVAVVQTRVKANGTTYFAGPKTARSRRTIAIDGVTIDSSSATEPHKRASVLHSVRATTITTSSSAFPMASHSTPTASASAFSATHEKPGYRCCGSTTCGTRTRRSDSWPTSTRRSCRNASATPPSPSPSTSTAMPSRRCKARLPRRSRHCFDQAT